jgi:hypothetical protein
LRNGSTHKDIFHPKNPSKYIGNNKTITYRSSWERVFMEFCDKNPNIIHWASESIKIRYFNPLTQKYTNYVPDFLIVYKNKDGKTFSELIEIKPKNQMLKEFVGKNKYNQMEYVKNLAKWQAAKIYCDKHNLIFRVINQDDMFHQGKVQ